MKFARTIELFSAGCPACDQALSMVQRVAEGCPVTVHDMTKKESARRAEELGVRCVPAVAVDGALAACCASGGPREEILARLMNAQS